MKSQRELERKFLNEWPVVNGEWRLE
jgi:hypothetical protein